MSKDSYTKEYVKPASSFVELNDTLIHSFSGIKSDITNLRDQNSQAQKRFLQIQEQLEGFAADFVTVDKYNVLKIKIAEVQDSLKQVWDIDKRLAQVDENSIKSDDFDKHLSSWGNDLEIIKQDLGELNETKVNKDQIRKLTDDINDEFDSLKDLFEDVRNTKNSASKFKKQVEGLKTDIDSLDKRNSILKQEKVSKKNVEKLAASINAEFDDVKDLISQIKSDQQKLVTSGEFKSSQLKNSKIQDKLFSSLEDLKKNSKKLTTIEQTENLIEDFNADIENLRVQISKTHKDFANKQKVASAALHAVTKSFLTKKDADKQQAKIDSELESIQTYVDSQSASLRSHVQKALLKLHEKEKKAAKRHKEFYSSKQAKKLEDSINHEFEELYAFIDSQISKNHKDVNLALEKVQKQLDKSLDLAKSHFTLNQAQKLESSLNKEVDSIYSTLDNNEKQTKSLVDSALKKLAILEDNSRKQKNEFYTKKQAQKLESDISSELDSVYQIIEDDDKSRTKQINDALAKVVAQEKKAAKRHKNYLTIKQSQKIEESLFRNVSSLREQLNAAQKDVDEVVSTSVSKKTYIKNSKSVKADIDALKSDIRESRKDFLSDIKDLRSHFTTELKDHKTYVSKSYLHVDQAETLVEDVNKEFITVQDQFEDINKQVEHLKSVVKSQAKELKEKDKLKKDLEKTKMSLDALHEDIRNIKADFVSNNRFQKTLKYFKKYIKELEKEAVEEERFDKLYKEVDSLKKGGFRKASITKESKKQVKLPLSNKESNSSNSKKASKSNKEDKSVKVSNRRAASEFKKLFQKKVQEKEDALPFSKTYKLANGLIILAFVLLIISIVVFFMGKITLTDRLAMISVVSFVVGLLLRLFVISKRD